MSRFDRTIELLEAELAAFEPDRVEGARACELVAHYARIERLAGAGKILALRQVAATGAWRHAGPFRDVSSWLASVTHVPDGQAHATTTTAQRLEVLPETEAAARAGALSGPQLDTITDAATADPGAERELLHTAARDGVRGLRERAAQVKAAACLSEVAREERIRADRSLRSWVDGEGVGHIHARGPVVEIAAVMSALQPFEKRIFTGARNQDLREGSAASAFDALRSMASASSVGAGPESTGPGQYVGVIRISHDALVRGESRPGEICELAGVGPIPVHEASRMLDDAFLKAVVVNGERVELVSHLGRTIPAHLRTAVEDTYQECCIQGCHEQRHLEIDHNTPIEHGGLTELVNLSRICTFHHRHKHKHNLRLAGNPTEKHFVEVHDLPPPERRPPEQRPPELRPELRPTELSFPRGPLVGTARANG